MRASVIEEPGRASHRTGRRKIDAWTATLQDVDGRASTTPTAFVNRQQRSPSPASSCKPASG
jgi:hypothetical protein